MINTTFYKTLKLSNFEQKQNSRLFWCKYLLPWDFTVNVFFFSLFLKGFEILLNHFGECILLTCFPFVFLFPTEPRRRPNPWTLRSTAAWAAVRICPHSAHPSTPNDLCDPSSSPPSSLPHLLSMPKHPLQVSSFFNHPTLYAFMKWDFECLQYISFKF